MLVGDLEVAGEGVVEEELGWIMGQTISADARMAKQPPLHSAQRLYRCPAGAFSVKRSPERRSCVRFPGDETLPDGLDEAPRPADANHLDQNPPV